MDADGNTILVVGSVRNNHDGTYTVAPPAGGWAEAVSYTHLDVYKRQVADLLDRSPIQLSGWVLACRLPARPVRNVIRLPMKFSRYKMCIRDRDTGVSGW